MAIDLDMSASSDDFEDLRHEICVCFEKMLGAKRYQQPKDYYIHDEFLGPSQILFHITNLELISSNLIRELRKCLDDYLRWEIVIIVCSPEDVEEWVEMGLYIRQNEIIDALRREYLPPEFENLYFEGARTGTEFD